MSDPLSNQFPLRLGTTQMFAQARDVFNTAEFNEANLCGILQLSSLSELGRLRREAIDVRSVSKKLAALVQAFLLGEPVARAEFERELPRAHLEALVDLDLLRPVSGHRDALCSPVFLYPVSDLLIASDRQDVPSDGADRLQEDSVFAAIFPGTLRFLKLLPGRPLGEALDLCSGTGIGALRLSGHARHVMATDLTARSVHFSRFNAALNNRCNLDAAQGDLYAAVAGQSFDVITAHPPYVPSLGDHAVYRDGGDAGETVVRRIVEGLPGALRRGGTFYSMSVGLDTKEGQFEERARRWLGAAGPEFDVVFAYGDQKSPHAAVSDIVSRAKHVKTLDAERLQQAYENLGALRLVYGALVIRHRADDSGQPWTLRPILGIETTGDDFDWLFEWRDQCARPGFVERLAGERPMLSPHLQVKAIHVVRNGALVPAQFSLEAARPFETTTNVDPWVVPLIAQLDGNRRLEELHHSARAAGEIPPGFGIGDFTKLTAMLIERGCLVLAKAPPSST